MNYDCLIVGAGFAGCVVARELADAGKIVHIIDKRAQIGGNMAEEYRPNGVRVHKYGPHIFHTSIERVYEYVLKYGNWFPYEHRVLGRIDGKLAPIPFNFTSLHELFAADKADLIENKLLATYEAGKSVSVLELLNSSDEVIKEFGKYVFDKVFVNYTAKQWDIPIEKVDTSVINRVPVVLGYDDRYFHDKYQIMPAEDEGFTTVFKNILNHENISVELNSNAVGRLEFSTDGKILFDGVVFKGKVVYTGAVDELLSYKFGILPYRSLDLVFEDRDEKYFQPSSVVNYPNEEAFTRITEFKYLTAQEHENTSILKEYPKKYDINAEKGNIPYYTIANAENLALFAKYSEYLSSYKDFWLCGRLAEYKYYNMDACIDRALSLSEIIKKSFV